MLIGCKGGDRCERLVDRLSGVDPKAKDKKVDPAARDKDIAECRERMKDPKTAEMADCMLAIDGDLTADKMMVCLKADEEDEKKARAKLTELAEKMCACKDAACATKVNEAVTAWTEDMKKNAPSNLRGAAVEDTQIRVDECMKKAMATP